MKVQDKILCGGFAAAFLLVATAFIVGHGWSWWLAFAGIALLLNAVVMTWLWIADAHRAPPEPRDVPREPQPPPHKDETQKALSGTDDLLFYLVRDEGHRKVLAHDLARFAEENGRPEFATRLRANF